jgi:hypothetical protein
MLPTPDSSAGFDALSKIKARRKINIAPVKVASASLPASYDLDVTTIAKTRAALRAACTRFTCSFQHVLKNKSAAEDLMSRRETYRWRPCRLLRPRCNHNRKNANVLHAACSGFACGSRQVLKNKSAALRCSRAALSWNQTFLESRGAGRDAGAT